MDRKPDIVTPQKRPNVASDVGRSKKRTPDSGRVSSHGGVSGSWKVYKLKILLPNGMTLSLKIPEDTESITVVELAGKVKDEYVKAVKKSPKPKKEVNWDAELYFLDDSDNSYTYRSRLNLKRFELNRVHNLRLHDGSQPAKIYENMWDLTPDTELLMELPEEYTFETALADIIDNSLQAVWSNGEEQRRLISVEVTDDKISILDTGPGMDSMSIEKWGKMGASLHRASKTQAIGGKPPYLKPAFGMFGYGGFVASMHLGRHTEVSSKTKNSKKVYMLRLERDALVSGSGSGSKRTWRTYGSLRDPMEEELALSPGRSFTKVEIFEPKMRSIDIRRLKCKLKDIYFPYIQCDDLFKGRTAMPIEFQVNDDDLAEIPGGEVAMTNLNSCNGPEFVLQLRFHLDLDNFTSTPGARTSEEANARLRCVYLPIKEGKESIQSILETLKKDGLECTEDFGSFSHVSCRRLGRLLPDARWTWLPFMDLRQKKGDRSHVLKRSCMRVKCFIETDAGFSPTPYKTDFAHQNPYTTALRNLGSRQPLEKETGVQIEIRKDARPLTLLQLEKEYQQWLVQMHETYDEEVVCGIDEPVFIINPIKRKELHIANNVVRVHKALRRKGKSWEAGQRIKILKGACAGFHKTNVYATLEYILLEGFQGDAGEAWIICRPDDVSHEDGCLLRSVDGNPILDLRKSVSLPISVIDSEKCLAIGDIEWDKHSEKQQQKSPSSIEILNSRQCHELGMKALLPDEPEVFAGHVPPCEIVAVVRPCTYKSGTPSKSFDQKYVMKDNFEMSLAITFSGNGDERNIYSGRVTPSSRRDFHGLYVFQPKCESYPLFHSAGEYTFTFSIRDSSCQNCVLKVKVNASPKVHRWALIESTIPSPILRVGSCCTPISVAKYDGYDNKIPFLEIPKMEVKVKCNKGAVKVCRWRPTTSSDKFSLKLTNLRIESSDLDNIRPSYDANLLLCPIDGPCMLDIPIKVFPGCIKRVTVQPEDFEKQLIPGQVVKVLILKLFDAYGNLVQENEMVQLSIKGFRIPDRSFSTNRPVDSYGCIDLSGLLTVTKGYGGKVSLTIHSDAKEVFSKEWQVEKRQLRITSAIPESCFAGSQLENLQFEVVNSVGDVDVSFHDEDEIGQSHTLTIKSEFIDVDESVKYVFRNGRCMVRTIPVPREIGDFSFVAAHSRHPELQLTIKVRVELSLETDLTINEDVSPLMNSPIDENRRGEHHIQERTTCSSTDFYHPEGAESDLESILDFKKDLENDIERLGLEIGCLEEQMKQLQNQQTEIESQMTDLKVRRDQVLSTGSSGSPGKNEIAARVECRADSAASLVMTLLRELSDHDHNDFTRRIIGIVALLGTTPTFELSRIFAEYLGDQMLAVVCKSYKDVCLLETYEKTGKLNHARLHTFATELGHCINGRYHVLCIEDISPCEALKDCDGRLILPHPVLSNGTIPPGFLDYAVNLIEIDVDQKTEIDVNLRETLFYRLFGKTQVYMTRTEMINAISCIKDGAISLDGGILRGNGAVSLGSWEPDIIFPVRKRVLSPDDTCVLKQYESMRLKWKNTMSQLDETTKAHERTVKKFRKKFDVYNTYFTQKQPTPSGCSQFTPLGCLEEKPNVQ